MKPIDNKEQKQKQHTRFTFRLQATTKKDKRKNVIQKRIL